jgi:hypothetical protein
MTRALANQESEVGTKECKTKKGRGPARTTPTLSVIVLFGVVGLGGVLYGLSHPVYDFVEYWSAAHLLVHHQNPYSLGEMFRTEKPLGMSGPVPLMLLSPPWTLAVIAPLGLAHSYIVGWFAWMLVMLAAIAISSRLLMDVYFDDLCVPEVSDSNFYRCLFAFTFFPLLLSLKFSQTTPLMLLGLSGFIYSETRRKPVWAGLFLSITLIKPHLTYLIWVALLLWTWKGRRWGVLIGAAASLVFLTALTLPFDPHIIEHYRELASSPYMQLFPSGITWGLRRLLGGIGTFWMEFVPPVAGLAWLAFHWRRHKENWSWKEQAPMLITVSVLTSAYGWLFDQTLLALPVIYLAAIQSRLSKRVPRNAILAYTALNCILMVAWPFPTIGLLPAPIFILVVLARGKRVKTYPEFDAVGVMTTTKA